MQNQQLQFEELPGEPAGAEAFEHQSKEVRRMNNPAWDPSLFGGIRRMLATGGVIRAELQSRIEAVRFTGTIQLSYESGRLLEVQYQESFGIPGQKQISDRSVRP